MFGLLDYYDYYDNYLINPSFEIKYYEGFIYLFIYLSIYYISIIYLYLSEIKL
jgi:hypothetical protein